MRYTRNIAILILVITFVYLFCVTFLTIPETGRDHAKTITGFLLGTGFGSLINYYWGASKSKKDVKDVSNRT